MTLPTPIHAQTPTPLEQLFVPEVLNGERGTNRASASTHKQIAANHDLDAIQTWLLEFEGSPQTQRTYRKEAERLLLWSLLEKQKAFSSLSRDDLRDYQQFLAHPTPQARWCGPRKPRHTSGWRPFQGPLSAHSIAHALTVVNALFNYLVEAGYLSGNPLGLLRRRSRKKAQQHQVIERYLERPLWQAVINYINTLPQMTPHEKTQYERIRFLFIALYLLGPRVSEIASHPMSSIRQIRGQWWWFVRGKGNKTEKIPVNESMLEALARYRIHYHLPPLPVVNEEHALFMNFNGSRGVSSNMIYRIVKTVFLECATTLETSRPEFALKLKKASTHWLRHTSLTHQADLGIELRYIKKNARHEHVETTMLYQHTEDEHWHKAMATHQAHFDTLK